MSARLGTPVRPAPRRAARRAGVVTAASRFAIGLLLTGSAAALATAAASASADPLDARETRLAHQLRCVVCQNQTIAESNAPLAADMRGVIREQLRDGRSDAEVIAFFEQRYGAFIRYSPPWQPSTWLLWLGPFIGLALGALLLATTLRRRQRSLAPMLDEAQQARVEQLLRETAPTTTRPPTETTT